MSLRNSCHPFSLPFPACGPKTSLPPLLPRLTGHSEMLGWRFNSSCSCPFPKMFLLGGKISSGAEAQKIRQIQASYHLLIHTLTQQIVTKGLLCTGYSLPGTTMIQKYTILALVLRNVHFYEQGSLPPWSLDSDVPQHWPQLSPFTGESFFLLNI